jgi:group II intron reverse transcriptase/maturase
MDPAEGKTAGTQGPEPVSTRLRRIAELARQAPEVAFTSLAHHIDVALLREAFDRTRKDGATGVDGQTAEDYVANLEGNLRSLLERLKSGTYRAPPVRRVHIPKGDGTKTRPIGIPTFEDKVLQRAVVMVLSAIYEQDFLNCSFGYRPGRSAHQAIDTLWREIMKTRGGWVLDVDIKGFFDNLDHGHLRSLLDQRVRDGVLRRVINKWLKAGVLENGSLSYPDTGTPQGGVVSPLLANVYLHEVLDKWFAWDVKPRLRGHAVLVRYADDFVIVFSREDDARRVLEVLPKRFGKYGLTLHPEKTRLLPFGKPHDPADQTGGPGTFDFLGFTHFWGRSRKNTWVVKRKTAASRFTRALKRIAKWCRENMHAPLRYQIEKLTQKLRGHCEYYGITGNSHALTSFRTELLKTWFKWLKRRSQKAKKTWAWFYEFIGRIQFPPAVCVHSVLRPAANP